MDSVLGFLIAFGWFLLRFGIPVLITLAICWVFKKIDPRWQAEGEAYRRNSGIENLVPVVRCWVFNDCPEEKRKACKAYQENTIPCWQHFRALNGELKENCISCRVFRGTPVTTIGD